METNDLCRVHRNRLNDLKYAKCNKGNKNNKSCQFIYRNFATKHIKVMGKFYIVNPVKKQCQLINLVKLLTCNFYFPEDENNSKFQIKTHVRFLLIFFNLILNNYICYILSFTNTYIFKY